MLPAPLQPPALQPPARACLGRVPQVGPFRVHEEVQGKLLQQELPLLVGGRTWCNHRGWAAGRHHRTALCPAAPGTQPCHEHHRLEQRRLCSTCRPLAQPHSMRIGSMIPLPHAVPPARLPNHAGRHSRPAPPTAPLTHHHLPTLAQLLYPQLLDALRQVHMLAPVAVALRQRTWGASSTPDGPLSVGRSAACISAVVQPATRNNLGWAAATQRENRSVLRPTWKMVACRR